MVDTLNIVGAGDTLDTVHTVDTVDAMDMVNTVDTGGNVDTVAMVDEVATWSGCSRYREYSEWMLWTQIEWIHWLPWIQWLIFPLISPLAYVLGFVLEARMCACVFVFVCVHGRVDPSILDAYVHVHVYGAPARRIELLNSVRYTACWALSFLMRMYLGFCTRS